MPMSRNSSGLVALCVRGALLLLAAAAVVTGCTMLGTQGPSNVALGKAYAPGAPQYDRFFTALYQVQLTMGQAPDHERALRERLAKVAEAGPGAKEEELGPLLQKRAERLAKHGVTLKVTVSKLDQGTDASARLSTNGGATTPADTELVATLDKAVSDAARLLTDMRGANPVLEKLKSEAPPLEPEIDDVFRKEGRTKRADVRKNLKDAEQLIPLMESRAGEPPPPSEAPPPKKRKGAKPKAASSGETKPPEPSPPPEPKPPPPKPKPPADDFEP